jgi:hypothetical protein
MAFVSLRTEGRGRIPCKDPRERKDAITVALVPCNMPTSATLVKSCSEKAWLFTSYAAAPTASALVRLGKERIEPAARLFAQCASLQIPLLASVI